MQSHNIFALVDGSDYLNARFGYLNDWGSDYLNARFGYLNAWFHS